MAPPFANLPVFFLILLLSAAFAAEQSDCGPGTFFVSSKCKKCLPGTYQPQSASTSCLSCPKGTFNIFKGAQGIDLCEPCLPDTFSTTIGATKPSVCKRCPPGTASVSGASECVTCPPGTYVAIPSGIGELHDREVASRLPTARPRNYPTVYTRGYKFCPNGPCITDRFPRKTRCRVCPPRTFSANPNSRKCTFCPFGQLHTSDNSGCMGCSRPGVSCVPGKGERACRQYQWNNGTFQRCQRCSPGFQANKLVEGTHCVPCAPGFFRSVVMQACNRCGKNRVLNEDSSECLEVFPNTACPDNYVKHANGHCMQCQIWERFNPVSKRCEECPENRVSNGGIDQTCVPCAAGSTRLRGSKSTCQCMLGWEPSGESCKQCPPGTFMTRSAGFYGTFQPVAGVLSTPQRCSPCPQGTFTDTAGSVKCRACQFNYVAPKEGSTKCVRCSRGMVPNAMRGCVSAASNCLPGETRAEDDNGRLIGCNSMKPCPENTYPIFSKVRRCGACNTYYRYDPVSPRHCIRCPNETPFSTGGVGTTCFNLKCENGFSLNPDAGKCECRLTRMEGGKCLPCPAGTSGDGCKPCPIGTGNCRKCMPGTFSDVEGGTECKTCPAGTINPYTGSSNCVIIGGLTK